MTDEVVDMAVERSQERQYAPFDPDRDKLKIECPPKAALGGGGVINCQATAQSATPRVTGCAYNGKKIWLAGFGPVVIDLNGLTFKPVVPLLADHTNRTEAVLGRVMPQVRDGKLFLTAPRLLKRRYPLHILKTHWLMHLTGKR